MIATIVCDLPVPGGCSSGQVKVWFREKGREGRERERTHPLDQTQSLAERHRNGFRLALVEPEIGVPMHRDGDLAVVAQDPRVDELVVAVERRRMNGSSDAIWREVRGWEVGDLGRWG